MPDFSYTGSGVRTADAGTDSPAAKAGLQKGDVIIGLDNIKIKTLRDYANALKQFKPNDRVKILYLRQGKQRETELTLIAR
jgi:serine protease Do